MVAQILRALAAAAVLTATLIATMLVLRWQWAPLPAMAAGIGVPLGAHALFLLAGFVGAQLAGRRARLPASARQVDAGGLLKAWVFECLSAWSAFLISQPLFGSRRLESARNPTRVPVLLVHGHMCNRAVWRPFARWLAARGHPVGSVNLEPVFAPIERHTELVHSELRRLLRQSRAPKAIVIGHSMGGLVLRAMLRDYGHDLVAQLVTVASPHRGTLLAYLSNQSNVRQMRPGSQFIRDLEAHEATHGLPKTTVVLSLHDNIVAPQANQSLPGARTQAWLGHGHLSLVFRSSVWSRLMQVCDAQAADPPRDEDRHSSLANGRPKPRAG